jgi:hypothetical protein
MAFIGDKKEIFTWERASLEISISAETSCELATFLVTLIFSETLIA